MAFLTSMTWPEDFSNASTDMTRKSSEDTERSTLSIGRKDMFSELEAGHWRSIVRKRKVGSW